MTRQTSVEAYTAIRDSKTLGERTWQTYATLYERGPMTQAEAWKSIPGDLPQRSITPRFAQLLRRGFIRYLTDEHGQPVKRKCAVSGRRCMVWDVTSQASPSTAEQPVTRLQRATARIAELERELGKATAQLDALRAKLARWGRPKNSARAEKKLLSESAPSLFGP